ncbi:MurR/RpiR family transcriptional regulator [Staphylococcus cohnii]|uniref:MurR/RpiR family transcriptional regulator n=1 Tax=Staphylococcus cohnii TaxID=29382 RepID=A0ABT6IXV9_9STAP|nr:MurR/RpiR family transcriptional regulator [Staphylococcus cohnii]MCI2940355.1 MurR/RpiR family transcriptional regulator [Staphylococcus cohnii]MDH5139332.1 MurR/RpiR family transcriptional regulator [Staphylococcus cohnii]MDH5157340.1 MurR/RpiR family transcriptional regulator [Staphylococcus cohnii]MDH5168893.1 MurR/RpiR family transcriptional regulator [Staphylococcus cohnii]
MNQNPDLKSKIVKVKKNLPKKQQKLCDFILKHFEDLGLITIKELSQQAEVGISTVMRTIHALDYENFNDFRKDIYNEALPNETKFSLKNAFGDINHEQGYALTDVWDKSVDLLNQSLKPDLIENFATAVEYIENATSVCILGTRPYRATALYFEHLLNEFYLNIHQLSNDTDAIFDKITKMTKNDILIVFAFEPYTNSVIQAVKETKRQGNRVILITDYDSSPVLEYATITLKLSVRKDHFSIIPIIALIDALVLEFGRRTSDNALSNLEKLEDVLYRNNITYHDE